MSRVLIVAAMVFLGAPAANGQEVTPFGSELQVNTYTTGNQDFPAVSLGTDGEFAVVWHSYGSTGTDSSQASVQGQRFGPDGTPQGAQFQVNVVTIDQQRFPALSHLADGGFVVVWESRGTDPTASIRNRRFAADGSDLGGEFQVNTYTTGDQMRPTVAAEVGGGFVVAWYTPEVHGRRFSSAGSAQGDEFQVNTYVTGSQLFPAVGRNPSSGDFVVVWQSGGSPGSDNSSFSIQAQRTTAAGAALGAQFQVNSYTTNIQSSPWVAVAPSGDFTVVWHSGGSYGTDTGSSLSIQGRRYASDGSLRGSQFQVNTTVAGSQLTPRLAADAGGDFVVTWVDGPGNVFVQRYTSDGQKAGSEVTVNSSVPGITSNHADLAMDAAGNFAVAWVVDDEATSTGIAARRYRSPCSASLGLATATWTLFSLPCDPGSSNTVADLFADDLTGTYATDWIVYERDEAAGQSVALTLASPLVPGVGYWVKTLNAGEVVDVGGLSQLLTEVDLAADAVNGVQNLAGHPFRFDVCWADVRIVDGSSVLDLDTADPGLACQSVPPDPGCVVSRIAHKWNGAAYEPFDGTTPGAEGTLSAFDGFWVEAFQAGAKLRIPLLHRGSCSGGLPALARGARLGQGEGYVRLIVAADGLEDPGNVLGSLAQSARTYDPHDLPELAPFAAPYLTIVFPHPEWGEKAGDYATDYRGPDSLRGDAWGFEVRSDTAREISLTWSGPSELLASSVLVDEERGVTVEPEAGGSYTTAMAGTVHRFSWRTGEILFSDGFETGDLRAWSAP